MRDRNDLLVPMLPISDCRRWRSERWGCEAEMEADIRLREEYLSCAFIHIATKATPGTSI